MFSKAEIVIALSGFLFGFITGALSMFYFYYRFSQPVALRKQKNTVSIISIGFFFLLAAYILGDTPKDNLVITALIAAILGQPVGSIAAKIINNGGKKND